MTKKPKAAQASDIESDLGENVTLASPEQTAQVDALVNNAVTLSDRITKGEELLKSLKGDLNTLLSDTLPKAMASANTSLHKIAAGPMKGWKVEVNPFIGGTLPKPSPKDEPEVAEEKTKKRERSLQFIRDSGADDIIKNTLTIEFDKGTDNVAGEVKGWLDENEIEYECEESINHQTYLAFIRECVKNGEAVPYDEMGLYPGQVAKLSPPKKKDLE
jgi:hypothetical protein